MTIAMSHPSAQRAETFTRWRELVSASFVPLEADPVAPGPFVGQVSGHGLQDLAVFEVDAMAHRVRRTPALINPADPGYYKVSLQMSGHGILIQDGREAVLSPGDLAIYDTQRPYTLSFHEDFSTLVLMFPKQLIGLDDADMSMLTARRLGSSDAVGRAVVPCIARIGDLVPEVGDGLGYLLARNAVDLLGTVLAAEVQVGPRAANAERVLQLNRIKHHVESHLSDPALTPGSIAAAHYISPRTLHKLFEPTGTTVSAWIRERRLDRSRRELLDPLLAHLPVGVIGARNGLPDAAHFSRCFRAAYGSAPSAIRARS
ncbi:AraC-like ligand-binding domain-containing protein [Arthrobacter rhombi]|uniref:AraC-like ligand-binding domain-containing protein n=1 Tax=Arthrobacter rhombi TaxID=71253 RepID=UPI003FD46382